MDTLLQDVGLALRKLRHSPGFAAVAIATLALGIGANTAIFSVIDRVLLQPLPYSQPDRLVRLQLKFRDGFGNSVSIPKFMAWKQHTQAFQAICAYNFSGPGLNLSGGAVPEQVKAIHVTADFFPVFDAGTMLGRVFGADEDRPGGPRLAVMTNGLWVRRFGGDPAIVGRAIVLDGEPYTVIGVLRASFRSYPPADLYLPLQADPATTNQGHFLAVAARLKPGVTLETAKAEMGVAAERFRQVYPDSIGKEESATAASFSEAIVGDVRKPLLVLLGAVAMVLLIACANVANLQLAQSTGRSRELAIRGALGAVRWRIIRQLLTESLVLALAGAAVGLVIANVGVRALLALGPDTLPRSAELTAAAPIDLRILAFTLGCALFTGLVFGLLPALQISRTDLQSTLKETSSRSGTGRHHYTRSALVVAETALAIVLLIGAALLIRTFSSLRSVDAGFNPVRVLSFETSLGGSKYKTSADMDRLTREVVRRLEAVPGVTRVANVPFLPLEGGFGLGFDIVGRPLAEGERNTGGAGWMYVSDAYFEALEIPLRRGRLFGERDAASAPGVVVVNEAFAKRYWPKGDDPLGHQIEIGKGMGPDFAEPPREIVGIVGDVKEAGLGDPAPPVMYIPLAQVKNSFIELNNKLIPTTWVVKTSVSPLSLASAVKQQVLNVDSQLAVAHERSLEQVFAEATGRQTFNMTLLSVFAGVALILAALGIYGTLSYSVEQRSQEIGIRMALGAEGADLRKMVIRQGMSLAGLGILIGLAGALALSRLITTLLFGVYPNDPVSFAAIAALLALVAFLATWFPARRATQVDPLAALRHE
jgi:putative ABC transport system permease protein